MREHGEDGKVRWVQGVGRGIVIPHINHKFYCSSASQEQWGSVRNNQERARPSVRSSREQSGSSRKQSGEVKISRDISRDQSRSGAVRRSREKSGKGTCLFVTSTGNFIS